MEKLGAYCDEFLIHAVDVEGKAKGIEVSWRSFLVNTRASSDLRWRRWQHGGYPDPQKWQQAENWM